MLESKRERKICRKYSKRDSEGKVHCNECPLVTDALNFLCKANSYYDKEKGAWVPDWW